MKKYDANKLIKNSRFKEYYQTLDINIKNNVINRINELIKLENIYWDKGNYEHLSNLFTALALYEEFIKSGSNEDEASNKVGKVMWDFVSKTSAPKMKKMGNLKIFIPFMKKIFT